MIIMDVLADTNAIFQSFLYGDGNIFGLILLLVLIVGLTMAWKYGGLLALFPCVYMGIQYFANDLGWHGIIMILSAIFIVIHIGLETRKQHG